MFLPCERERKRVRTFAACRMRATQTDTVWIVCAPPSATHSPTPHFAKCVSGW